MVQRTSSGRPAVPVAASDAFDRRVAETASALRAAGVSPKEIRLPYVGPPAQVVGGAVVPGYASHDSNVSSFYSSPPAPSGIAYYGENNTSGVTRATTLDASSVVGTLTVNQLGALYLDDNTPDMWGVQLNAVISNVTLHGRTGSEFWVQNSLDYYQHNDTLQLGEDTWNFSSSTASIGNNTSTILQHSANGSVIGGLYVGEGPYLPAPTPFTIVLYLNSSVTRDGEQECWFNYTLASRGGVPTSGSYDWLVFNSSSPEHPARVSLAPFEATGTHLDPVGLTNDFEFDFGIGPYDASTLDVLSANASASLEFCPAANATCGPNDFRPVPAAEDFGGETGETSSGLSFTYEGTTEYAYAGPFMLRGLWGYSSARGSAPGTTPVTNVIAVSGSPIPLTATPYVFVFFNGSTSQDSGFEWAPDVPVWYLAPGTYQYEAMLADYAEQTGTLVVGTSPTSLALTLPYHRASGVYTPLWAFGDAQLAGISQSGNGTISSQYLFFNNPTADCSECGNAADGNLSANFRSSNDATFPEFSGILLADTHSYVHIDRPVSFDVFSFSYGPRSQPTPGPNFYLQIELVSTSFVTLSNDSELGGWPAMSEITTLAGVVDPADNPSPQANVILWNSTHDVVMASTFVPAWLVPPTGTPCNGTCPAVTCDDCVAPDGLLLYGGTRNTVWGNTFKDPVAPPSAPPQVYAGLAEAESGDLIFNNNFSVDNPTVYLPFDIYNESCPSAFAGDCPPVIPTQYTDTWNVSSQPAHSVAVTVNGFALSGNILGAECTSQGGNFWSTYGNDLNPVGVLPFRDQYAYSELEPIFPEGSNFYRFSIEEGGDYLPLTHANCERPVSPFPWATASNAYLVLVLGSGTGVAVAIVGTEFIRFRRGAARRVGQALWGEFRRPISSEEAVTLAEMRPTFRERWARHPPNLSMWVGGVLLAAYLVAAVSAVIVFSGSLSVLPFNPAWANPATAPAPTWAHPFGVMPGLNTDLFRTEWQATPWDLTIVTGILGIDVAIGFLAGAYAGANEGGVFDSVVTFVGDSIGSIPTFLFVIILFAGLATVSPVSVGLLPFIAIFGLVLWPTLARSVRDRARTVAHEPYVDSARSLGATPRHILWRHILPNSLGPVLAQIPLDVAPIFFVLSAFPWFYNCAGFGPPPPPPGSTGNPAYLIPALPPFSPLPSVAFPEWGFTLAVGTCEGIGYPGEPIYWWMFFIPLAVIVVFGLSLGLLCDGVDRWRRLHP